MSQYNELYINYDATIELEEKIEQLGDKAEYEINNYFWNTAAPVIKAQVYSFMPRSSKDKSHVKRAPKTHAKDSDSLDTVTYNQGVKVRTKTKPTSKNFGYLIFPDEGRGIHQKYSQMFFARALAQKQNEITSGLEDHLNKYIEEEL